MTKIGLASDHAGFELKEFVKKWLQENGYEYIDYGTCSTDSVDYPDYAHKLSVGIENSECIFGVAVCGTGNGISMALNKHSKIRAALCWNSEISELARQHNDANILVMPGRFISKEEATEILNKFFNTPFEGGRHKARIDKIPFR